MILAGDIGGTHTRLAGFETSGNRLESVVEKDYKSDDKTELAEIILSFIRSEGIPARRAVLGVAGPVRGGRSKISNLNWIIDARDLKKKLNMESMGVINDLEAYAYGIDTLDSNELLSLHAGAEHAEGNMGVMAAGTGLGEAGMYWDGIQHHPFACEGGHSSFSPGNELEAELYKYLAGKFGHVSWERIISGPGLQNVYNFLRDTKKVEEPAALAAQMKGAPDVPALISQLGTAKQSPICEKAVDLFVSIYGSEAGNCALKFLSTAGFYVGGNIAVSMMQKINSPLFLKPFMEKGRMKPLLESMPVKLVLNNSLGLVGAARFALIQKAFGKKTN